MSKKRRIRTHAPKIARPEGKKEESTYWRIKRHHRERVEKQAKMRGETKKQEFDSIAYLHGALGNKKVTELHQTGKLMAMLKMSKPGDRYEREADQIASQVMNTNPGTVHENSSAKVAPKVDLSKVNKKNGTTTTTQIKNLSGGEKLDGSTKKFFKSRFDGLDLSKVNIHKSRKANNMAESINARAFTYGNNIVFNKGEYKPNTFQGKKLLAHELAHVAQQTGTQHKKFSRKIKMDEPGKKVNAGNITDADRMKALENFGKRHKFKKVEQPQAKVTKKNNNINAEKPPITKIDKPVTKVAKPPIIKEESVNRIPKSEVGSVAPPVKVSFTQGKVIQGAWGKKKDEKDNEEEKEKEKDKDQRPKGIGWLAWKIFKGALGLLGIDVDQIMGILGTAAEALGAIIKDPKGFFGNLGKAVKGGINNFVKNFKKHLLNGISGWLFGQLGDAGLEMPSSFDFKGILSVVLQVIGLTYGNIRGQIVDTLGKGGEEMMSHAESMFEHLKTAISEGPMALWEQLKEHLAGLKDQFFGMIIDWVKTTVIKQGVMFLISMLNPAGAIVQAIRAIIKVVTFFMERWQQIQDFASSVVDSVSLIAKGDVTAAQNGVENSLAKAMPITISFIAKLVGLGGISKHITKVIDKIRKPINNAVKKVTGKIAGKIKNLPIFKKGKKALNKGKKAVEKGKKKLNDAKESVDKAIDDKGKKMRKDIEDGRADKQKKKEDEVKEKNKKGKDAHKDKEQLTEDDKKKHKTYVAEIIQKLQADKGNNAKNFKEFHASKVKLAKDLEGRYQKKLKRGINIDITIPPLEKDKKDNDVDVDIKIAPNATTGKTTIKGKTGPKTLKAWLLNENPPVDKYMEVKVINNTGDDGAFVGYEGKDQKTSTEGIIVGDGNKTSKAVNKIKESTIERQEEIYKDLKVANGVSGRKNILASLKEGVTEGYRAKYVDNDKMSKEYQDINKMEHGEDSERDEMVKQRGHARKVSEDIKGHKDSIKKKGNKIETEELQMAGESILKAIMNYKDDAKEEIDMAGVSKKELEEHENDVRAQLDKLKSITEKEDGKGDLGTIGKSIRDTANKVCNITKRYSEKIAEKETKRRFEAAGFKEEYPRGDADKQGAGDVDKIFIKKQGKKYIVVEVKGGGSQLGARDIKHDEELAKENVRAQQGNIDYLLDTARNMQKSAENKIKEIKKELEKPSLTEKEIMDYTDDIERLEEKIEIAEDLEKKIKTGKVDYLHATQKFNDDGTLGDFELKQFKTSRKNR